jgi:hypothetical protein
MNVFDDYNKSLPYRPDNKQELREFSEEIVISIRKNSKTNYSKLDRKMGYISSVTEAKEILEKLYKLNINS